MSYVQGSHSKKSRTRTNVVMRLTLGKGRFRTCMRLALNKGRTRKTVMTYTWLTRTRTNVIMTKLMSGRLELEQMSLHVQGSYSGRCEHML